MGKGKKRPHHPSVEELLQRPWCYYCERDFDDLKILHSHQKAKHFRCDRCNRRLNTAGGLAVHMTQVHKEELTVVENALPNRQGLEVEIFGLEGVPPEALQQHNQRLIQQFYEEEAERRKATGNPAPGGNNPSQPKKIKVETPEERKARLAEFRAKRAAELAGQGSGNNTPGNVGSPSGAHSPSGSFSQHQANPGLTQGYPSYPGMYGGQQQGFSQPIGQQSQPYGQNTPFNQQGAQGSQYVQNNQGFPNQQFPHQSPYQQFVPPGQPPQNFVTTSSSPGTNGPSFQSQPPNALGNSNYNLPNAQGLPQRPNFSSQLTNIADVTQTNHGGSTDPRKADAAQLGKTTEALSLDELVSSAAKAAERNGNTNEDPKKEKKAKKDSGKNIRLVYSDNDISPEEKMARLPRYAFNPVSSAESVLGTLDATVTGTVRGADTAEAQA